MEASFARMELRKKGHGRRQRGAQVEGQRREGNGEKARCLGEPRLQRSRTGLGRAHTECRPFCWGPVCERAG